MFADAIGLKTFTVYQRIIVQDGSAYDEGICPQWNEIRDYWEHPTEEKKQNVYAFLIEEGIKKQDTGGLPDEILPRVSPELARLDWELLKRPGNIDMQYELNSDLKNHIGMFPVFQEYFRYWRQTLMKC